MSSVERHEAAHAAAFLLAGITPVFARSDWPSDNTAGSVRIDWGDLTEEKARAGLLGVLCGAWVEDGLSAWEQWPPDPNAVPPCTSNDLKQATALAKYLDFDAVDWHHYLFKARRLARTPAFRRLVGAIERELVAREFLPAAELDAIKEATCCT